VSKKVQRRSDSPTAGGVRYFCGQYRHNLDPKRRLTIPAEWRAIVGEPSQFFVVPSVGEPRLLYVYPARVMEPKLQNIHNLPMADAKGRAYLRIMGARSEILGWDVQGRIRIRDDLLEYARLTDEVLLVGNYEGFELWNPDEWRKFEQSVNEQSLVEASKYVGI